MNIYPDAWTQAQKAVGISNAASVIGWGFLGLMPPITLSDSAPLVSTGLQKSAETLASQWWKEKKLQYFHVVELGLATTPILGV